MTDEELKAIEERAAAATEGPWEADPDHAQPRVITHCDVDRFLVARISWDESDGPERHAEAANTATFIAAARQDVPALVKELRAAREVLASVQWVDVGPVEACPSCDAMGPRVQRCWANEAAPDRGPRLADCLSFRRTVGLVIVGHEPRCGLGLGSVGRGAGADAVSDDVLKRAARALWRAVTGHDPMYYDRKGQPIDLMTWGAMKQTDKRVAMTHVAGTDISTVWVGLDMSMGEGLPVIFETMVFGGPLDGETVRYSTEEEAVAGHAAMVDRVWARLAN